MASIDSKGWGGSPCILILSAGSPLIGPWGVARTHGDCQQNGNPGFPCDHYWQGWGWKYQFPPPIYWTSSPCSVNDLTSDYLEKIVDMRWVVFSLTDASMIWITMQNKVHCTDIQCYKSVMNVGPQSYIKILWGRASLTVVNEQNLHIQLPLITTILETRAGGGVLLFLYFWISIFHVK